MLSLEDQVIRAFFFIFYISTGLMASGVNYSKLASELDFVELEAGKLREQKDIMEGSINSTGNIVSNLDSEIILKEQELISKQKFIKERIQAVLPYSIPVKIEALGIFNDFEKKERVKNIISRMLKKDLQQYNNIQGELNKLKELKNILDAEKNKLEKEKQRLTKNIEDINIIITKKKNLLHKMKSTEQGRKILAERSRKSEERIEKIVMAYRGATGSEVLFSELLRPLQGKIVSSFGKVWNSKTRNWIYNKGVLVTAGYGSKVQSISDGVVSYVGWLPAYGRVVIIKHNNGLFSIYAHLSRFTVANKLSVKKGTIIGFVGDTGSIDKPALYFELSTSTNNVDPTPLFL